MCTLDDVLGLPLGPPSGAVGVPAPHIRLKTMPWKLMQTWEADSRCASDIDGGNVK